MWDYEENLDDVHYYNTNEDDIEDDDDADSEVEALMYSNIHYQGDFTRNDERNVSIIQPEVVQNVEKRMKKVKIDKSNKKMVKKKPETNYGVEKLTQFVSVVKHNPRARSKDPGSSSQEVVVISSDSDVKVVDVVKSNRKIVETKKKKKEEKGIFVSDSDSDSFFEGNDVGVDLPVDININISARSGYNEEMSEICSKKEKIGEISAKKRKISDVFTPVKKKIRKSGDFSVDYAEKMRKFYDSESSEDEIEVAKLDLVQGSWKIDDSDRFGWISDKKRFFGGGFTPKIKVKCRNCQQWGHFERDCQEKIRVPHCSLCGETDHKAEECLSMLCARCEGIGHHVSVCQISTAELKTRCKRCRVKGHSRENCPDLWRRYHLTISDGPIVRGPNEPNPRVFCYNCGKKGHWGHKCPNPLMTRAIQPTKPFVISYEGLKRITNDDYQRQEMLDASNNRWKQIIERQWGGKRQKRNKWNNSYNSYHDKREDFSRDFTRSESTTPKKNKKNKRTPKRREKCEDSSVVETPVPKKPKRKMRIAKQSEKLEDSSVIESPAPKKLRRKRVKTQETVNDTNDIAEVDFFRSAVKKMKARIKKREEKVKLKESDSSPFEIHKNRKKKCKRPRRNK